MCVCILTTHAVITVKKTTDFMQGLHGNSPGFYFIKNNFEQAKVQLGC